MDLIPINISYDGKWTKNKKDVWLYEDTKMNATYIRKSSMMSDMKDAFYKSLIVDLP